ncbi:MAG TPA: metal-dependent hydrolase [Methanoregulaceae archaeon]|nr:metal-dependent hydrolase [Methanoregulaceae archaeon]HQJ87320.1 metal-dependent hydrolase [Methanoregulaceae archaeon]
MRLTYVEHACVLLEGTRRVLVDPYVQKMHLPADPDLVVVTHGHRDHLGETLALARPTVTTNEIAKELVERGVPAEGINAGGGVELAGVRITMTPALHSNILELDGQRLPGGDAGGMVIEMDGVTVYHAGDTALFSDMKLIGTLHEPDVALLPIGGRFTMDPSAAMCAARWIGAPLVVPIHYNTWPVIAQDPLPFKEALERTTDIRVAVLAPGESIELP